MLGVGNSSGKFKRKNDGRNPINTKSTHRSEKILHCLDNAKRGVGDGKAR